jgi:hypothetical protein
VWFGVVAPAGTPGEIMVKLQKEFVSPLLFPFVSPN